jgi:hypothetical protein
MAVSEVDLTVLQHSDLGPSASERWCPQQDGTGGCTASVTVQRGIPDSDSDYAAEGTAAHILTEWVRRNELPADQFPDKEISVPRADGSPRAFPVTREMQDAADDFAERCNAFLAQHAFFEQRVHYTRWVPAGFGTADDIRIKTGESTVCKITDFKYGEGVQVFAEWNTQLMLYACGVIQDLGALFDIDEFILAIHQPRLDHYAEWSITTAELMAWIDMVAAPAAREAMGDAPVFKAGDHCRFCRIKSVCKARVKWLFDTIDFANLDNPKLDGESIARVLPHLDAIRGVCNDLEAVAMKLIQQRQKVGDWKLVEGRSNRQWAIGDDKELIKSLRKYQRLTLDQVAPRKVITITEAEALLGKKHPALQLKTDADDTVGLVVKPKGKPKLARGDDSRTAIIDGVQFEDLTASPPVGVE